MQETTKNRIKVADILAPILSSRDITDTLRETISQKTSLTLVELDFSDVKFISRSAAHQLLVIKEELRLNERDIAFTNTNDEVTEMLRIVAANRAIPKKDKPEFKAEKIDIEALAHAMSA